MKIVKDSITPVKSVMRLGELPAGTVFEFHGMSDHHKGYKVCMALGQLPTSAQYKSFFWCVLGTGEIYTRTEHDARPVVVVDHELRTE